MSYSPEQIKAAIMIAVSSDNPSVQSALDSLISMISIGESVIFEAATINAKKMAKRTLMLNGVVIKNEIEPSETKSKRKKSAAKRQMEGGEVEMTLIPQRNQLVIQFMRSNEWQFVCAVDRSALSKTLENVAKDSDFASLVDVDDGVRNTLIITADPHHIYAFGFSFDRDIVNLLITSETDPIARFKMDRAQFDELREAVEGR